MLKARVPHCPRLEYRLPSWCELRSILLLQSESICVLEHRHRRRNRLLVVFVMSLNIIELVLVVLNFLLKVVVLQHRVRHEVVPMEIPSPAIASSAM